MIRATFLERVPGIGWMGVLAAIAAGAGLFGLGASIRTDRLETRARRADSTATAATLSAQMHRRQAMTAHAEALAERERADSLSLVATAARQDVAARVKRARTSRARVDTTGLPTAVLVALADADSLRLAVTPALVADAAAIAGYQATIQTLEATVAHQAAALDDAFLALAARADQIAALEQRRPPRCGWRCGAALGVGAFLVAPKALELVRAAVTEQRP